MAERVIYHIDVNSAFLSWEAVFRLKFLGAAEDLRMIPSAVGGDVERRHGIILAKSIPAKAYHIKTGESVPEALEKCPFLRLVPPNYGLYERCSTAFFGILREYTPSVEQYSIDEAYMDMTGMGTVCGDPVRMAERIRERIRDELGFTVNIGISENKLLAKMASDFRKPDRVHTLFHEEIPEKMWGLPVTDLFFVGRANAKKLFKLGIYTIGDLAGTDPDILRFHFKSYGQMLHDFANGLDFSVVDAAPHCNKGYGNSTTLSFDVTDAGTAKIVLLALSETVGMRLRRDHVKVRSVSVSIRNFKLEYASHECVLRSSTNITTELCRAACALFDELWDYVPIRHLGIHTGRVEPEEACRQLTLFDNTDYAKLERWDRTIDTIRGRYGIDSVKRCVFLSSPRIDHLSGGISREKRSVDYDKESIK